MSAQTRVGIVLETVLVLGLLLLFAIAAFTGDTHGAVVFGLLLLMVELDAFAVKR